jgi:hypothetical protein
MRLLSELEMDDRFSKLFSRDPILIHNIAENMKVNGFDKLQPLAVLKGTNKILDGMTRFDAAKEAGLFEVPVYELEFSSNAEAKLYTWNRQALRRQTTDAQLYEAANDPDLAEMFKNKPGRTTVLLADTLGVSESTIVHARAVEKRADDKTKEEVKSGAKSVAAAYNALPKVQKKTNFKKTEKLDASDSLSDHSGEPAALNLSHESSVERPHPAPFAEDPESETDRIASASRTARAEGEKDGWCKGFAEGFQKALIFALAESKKGRTPESIYSDPLVSDLSASSISGFVLPAGDEDIFYGFSS